MTAIGSFDGVVTFGCTGLPAGVACNFTPPGLTPGANGQATSALTITTQSPHGSRGKGGNDGENEGRDGDGHGRAGTPRGTHAITVIGTSGGSPAITHEQSFTLVVK